MPSYTAPPLPVDRLQAGGRVELVFSGVEQGGPSFEARVFLNNPDADESTPKTPDMGYAGSFHVYGYGEPVPPAIAEARERRAPGGPPLAPIEKRLEVDEAALQGAVERSDELIVTVVPLPSDPGGPAIERPFERVEIMLGRAR